MFDSRYDQLEKRNFPNWLLVHSTGNTLNCPATRTGVVVWHNTVIYY